MSNLEHLDRVTAEVAAIVGQVRENQLDLRTACSEWNVREVVNHLAHGALIAAAWVTGQAEPDEEDHLGSDVRGGFEATAKEIRIVFGAPGFLDRTIESPLGSLPGRMLVASRINELLVHGWDIADATGQSTDLEPGLAEQALAQWKAHLGDSPRQATVPSRRRSSHRAMRAQQTHLRLSWAASPRVPDDSSPGQPWTRIAVPAAY